MSRNANGQRFLTIWVARRRGDVAVLRTALTDPDYRAVAAESLGKLGCQQAAPDIARLLAASDPNVRITAVRALGRLRAREFSEEVATVAQADPEENARAWALAALGEIGDPASLPVLLRSLESPARAVRAGAAVGLGHMGNAEAVPALMQAKRRERLRSRRPYRRAIAAITRDER